MPDASVDLIYIDPPFNTGKVQRHTQLKTVQSDEGDRSGFAGRRYRTSKVATRAYADAYDDYLAFLEPRLVEAHRVLAPTGSLYFHIDYREVHYCKLLLDGIFGRDCFLNEIIWAYDYGARATRRWPAKHDNILFYVKDPEHYLFNTDEVERIPYMAPGLVGAGEGRARQAADRHLVAHDRADQRRGAHRLPDAEARRHPEAHRRRFVAAGRPRARLLRRQRDNRRGLPRARPALHPDRQ